MVEIIVRHRLGAFTAKKESHPAAAVCDVLRRLDSQTRKAHDKLGERRRYAVSVITETADAS